MYVAMANECGLDKWTSVSQVDHAVSKTITGPYEFHDVAIGVWSHNPAPITLPDGTFAIFSTLETVYTTETSRIARMATTEVILRTIHIIIHIIRIHRSHIVLIVWTVGTSRKQCTSESCNNPAPLYIPMARFSSCQEKLYRTESIHNNWTFVSNVGHPNGPSAIYEDPYLRRS